MAASLSPDRKRTSYMSALVERARAAAQKPQADQAPTNESIDNSEEHQGGLLGDEAAPAAERVSVTTRVGRPDGDSRVRDLQPNSGGREVEPGIRIGGIGDLGDLGAVDENAWGGNSGGDEPVGLVSAAAQVLLATADELRREVDGTIVSALESLRSFELIVAQERSMETVQEKKTAVPARERSRLMEARGTLIDRKTSVTLAIRAARVRAGEQGLSTVGMDESCTQLNEALSRLDAATDQMFYAWSDTLSAVNPNEQNFSYGRFEEIAPRGRVTQLTANLRAIELLKELERENRLATPSEKKELAAYTGFGGHKEVFNESTAHYRTFQPAVRNSFAFYPPWEKEYGRWYDAFKAVMTEEEWRMASASVLNAHYTSGIGCHALWDAAKRLGFTQGKVLEPTCGIGSILGAMPEDLRGLTEVHGIELDSISARICKALYPQSQIEESSLQSADGATRNTFDLAITNVPFSDVAPGDQNYPVRLNLHNYCIARAVSALRPGAIAIIITSSSTMENNSQQREFLASRTELIGAIRLPNSAFAASANTEVVTDILILRKPSGELRVGETWAAVIPLEVGEAAAAPNGHRIVSVNEYFHRHPEMVLGAHSLKGRMYGASEEGQYTVVSDLDEPAFREALSQAIGRLPENVLTRAAKLSAEEKQSLGIMAVRGEKERNFVVRDIDGKPQVFVVGKANEDLRRNLERPAWWNTEFALPRRMTAHSAEALAVDYIRLRTAFQNLISADLNPLTDDATSAGCRADLNEAYDDFVANWGKVNESPAIERIVGNDPDFGAVAALESGRMTMVGKVKKIEHQKAAIFEIRTVFPALVPQRADSVIDGINISLNVLGRVDDEYIAGLLQLSQDVPGVKKLILDSGIVFENPETGALEHRVKYLSGNVGQKLESARKAGEKESRFLSNVQALEAVQPVRVTFNQITAPLGAPWLPSGIVEEFFVSVVGQKIDAVYVKSMHKWVLGKVSESSVARATYATPYASVKEVIEAALSQKMMKIFDSFDNGNGGTSSVLNVKESAKANERVAKLQEDWKVFIGSGENRQKAIEEAYNESFNQVRVPDYTGEYLTFPGIAQGPGAMAPRPHQRSVVARMISEQAGLIAHGVGYGKTFELCLIAMESKRLGLANKPLILCDNASYGQFVATMRRIYPQAQILESTPEDVSEKNRDRFVSMVATGAWDVVMMAHSHFDRIPNTRETEIKYVNQRIEELRKTKAELGSLAGKKLLERQIAKSIASEEAKLTERMRKLRERGDDCMCWENMGVDLLLIDELHRYKKLPFTTNFRNVKGIDTTNSQRGERMLMKAMELQERRGEGKGVVGATGTPVTNTMAEVWNMIRLCTPTVLDDFNVRCFDEFMAFCCQRVVAMELNESNLKWRTVERLAKFFNGPSFVQFVRSGMDVQMDPTAVQLNIPQLKGGKIQLAAVNQTDAVADLLQGISDIYDVYEHSSGSDKVEMSYIPIMLMQVGMAAAIDPRLIDADAPDDPNSVVNQAVDNIVAIWKESTAVKGTQAVFLDRYNRMDTSILNRIIEGGIKAYRPEFEDAVIDESVNPEEKESSLSSWNLYNDIRSKLVARGIPADEICIVNEAKNDEARKTMFERVNRGDSRVIIGSTKKLGTGVNIQRKLIHAHHLDPSGDLTPASMTQRNGRILRDGNEHKVVGITYYGMVDTATPGIFHRLQRKDAFIAQVFSTKGVGLEFEDCGEVNLEEMKASLISDKRQLQRAELLSEIREARMRVEMAQDRQRSLTATYAQMMQQSEGLEATSIPRAEETAAWVRKHVTPINVLRPMDEMSLDYPGAKIPFVSTVQEGVRFLESIIRGWKELPLHGAVKQIGAITLNGLRMNISKELSALENDEKKGNLVAVVPHPVQRGWNLGPEVKFSNANGLLRILQSRFDESQKEPARLRTLLTNVRKDIGEVQRQREMAPVADHSIVRELVEKLEALETDMRENPMERRGSKNTKREKKGQELARPSENVEEDSLEIKVHGMSSL